jgi:hypothetical protein
MYFIVKTEDCLIATSPLYDSDSERMQAVETLKKKLISAEIIDLID